MKLELRLVSHANCNAKWNVPSFSQRFCREEKMQTYCQPQAFVSIVSRSNVFRPQLALTPNRGVDGQLAPAQEPSAPTKIPPRSCVRTIPKRRQSCETVSAPHMINDCRSQGTNFLLKILFTFLFSLRLSFPLLKELDCDSLLTHSLERQIK